MQTSQKARQKPLQPRNWPITQLPGLSDRSQSQLQDCGIATTAQLLQKADSPAAKLALANQLQVHIQYINKWTALADLSRIPSVGCQYCGLILHAGIASVTQLAKMPVHRLHQQILKLQVSTMQRRDLCPSIELVQKWIQQAKILL